MTSEAFGDVRGEVGAVSAEVGVGQVSNAMRR